MMKEFIAGLLATLSGLVGASGPLPDQPADMSGNTISEMMQEFDEEQQSVVFDYLGDFVETHRPEKRMRMKPSLPDDWQEMSEEERQVWMQADRAAKFEERFGVAQPDGWEQMMPEDRRIWMTENIDSSLLPQKPERPELPENWEDMSGQERYDWKQENAPGFKSRRFMPHRPGKQGFGPQGFGVQGGPGFGDRSQTF